MQINTQMNQAEMNKLNYQVKGFNDRLKEKHQGSKNKLGEADFMKLLVTQLKTQDPTKPLDDKEFIGQMAQFTSLKQMNTMAKSLTKFTKEFSFTKAVGLVGKEVSWNDESGRFQKGIVQSVKLKGGDTFLNVNGNELTIADIKEVAEAK